MDMCMHNSAFRLICVVVNYGEASKVIRYAKQHGVTGATVCLGRGLVNNPLLKSLAVSDVRREIIYMVTDREGSSSVLAALEAKYRFNKPHNGIAFGMPVNAISGTRCYACETIEQPREAKNPMYHLITAVVDKGLAEDVIDAATAAGSRGGTIINARGSGIHETSRVFSMNIEPEREIAMIVSNADKTMDIVTSIRQHLDLDAPGKGIVYVQEVDEAYGLSVEKPQ